MPMFSAVQETKELGGVLSQVYSKKKGSLSIETKRFAEKNFTTT